MIEKVPVPSQIAPERRMKSLQAILLEDDAEQAYLLARFLESLESFKVELSHFTTTERAMSELMTQKADLVFLDHYLGGGQTGLEFLRTLREFGFDGPIVMLTGSDDAGLVASFLRCGADAYVCKSDLDPVTLESTIQIALTLPHKAVPRLVLDQPTEDKTLG